MTSRSVGVAPGSQGTGSITQTSCGDTISSRLSCVLEPLVAGLDVHPVTDHQAVDVAERLAVGRPMGSDREVAHLPGKLALRVVPDSTGQVDQLHALQHRHPPDPVTEAGDVHEGEGVPDLRPGLLVVLRSVAPPQLRSRPVGACQELLRSAAACSAARWAVTFVQTSWYTTKRSTSTPKVISSSPTDPHDGPPTARSARALTGVSSHGHRITWASLVVSGPL